MTPESSSYDNTLHPMRYIIKPPSKWPSGLSDLKDERLFVYTVSLEKQGSICHLYETKIQVQSLNPKENNNTRNL